MSTHQRHILVELTTNLAAQMHELKRLRNSVRKALSAKARRIPAEKELAFRERGRQLRRPLSFQPRIPIPRQLPLSRMVVLPVGENALDCSPCSDEALSGTNPDDHDGQRKGDANRATNRQRERR